jgi:NtrC-family two-component system sensor histidine kinase KinB
MPKGFFSSVPPRSIKYYLFVGFSAVLLALFVFSNVLLRRLGQETERTSRVFAGFCATASYPAAEDTLISAIVAEVIQSINFPIVLTDAAGLPRAWKEVGVAPADVPVGVLDSLTQGLTPSRVMRERVESVKRAAAELDRRHPPIPLMEPQRRAQIGLVHWGEPRALEFLRYVPYLSTAIIVFLLGLTFWGARGLRLAESRRIWVGLAKETAHQLGTPLSSLMGWVELLREQVRGAPPGPTVPVGRPFLEQTLEEMENDVHRLSKVAGRFSQIGSVPALVPQDLAPVVAEAVDYLKRRLPDLGRSVSVQENYGVVPPVNANRELLEWVVENLLVNAMNAIEGREGRIEVKLQRRPETETVELEITDSGRGMTVEEQRRAFEAGFTTKKRGWGLGLALAKRIVEDYHGGRIFIRHTAPGKGTTFVIRFPT